MPNYGPTERLPLAQPLVETPDGQRITVPFDPKAIAELQDAFAELSAAKQEFLLTRFPFCDTDTEALGVLAKSGSRVTQGVLSEWKRNDLAFHKAYRLMGGGLIDWPKYLVMSIELGNAILGALASRQLLQTPWKDLDARATSAKMQAAQASLDRVVGRKQEIDVNIVKISDLLPKRG